MTELTEVCGHSSDLYNKAALLDLFVYGALERDNKCYCTMARPILPKQLPGYLLNIKTSCGKGLITNQTGVKTKPRLWSI